MQNIIQWFEIPALDFKRAVEFYKAVLSVEIQESDMFGTKMGFFPSDGANVSGAIVQGDDYKPSTEGITVYLNGGEDLQAVLGKVEKQGGKVMVEKTEISPEMGFMALFIDTEGNKMALHSMK